MDAERFAAFFGGVGKMFSSFVTRACRYFASLAATFRIPGRTFNVTKQYAKIVPEDYVEAAVKQVIQIHLTADKGDILVFMTGQEDIEATCELLAQRVEALGSEGVSPMLVLPMYSQLPADLQVSRHAVIQPPLTDRTLSSAG
jgi:pre-mRNA-splicing factor ATP-dependent RNA helicase DHX38/PRP16